MDMIRRPDPSIDLQIRAIQAVCYLNSRHLYCDSINSQFIIVLILRCGISATLREQHDDDDAALIHWAFQNWATAEPGTGSQQQLHPENPSFVYYGVR